MTFPPALLGNSEHEGTQVVHDGNISRYKVDESEPSYNLFKELLWSIIIGSD